MKNWLIFALFVVVAVLCYLLFSRPVPEDVKSHYDSIDVKRNQIDSLLKLQQDLRLKMYKDSVDAAERLESLKYRVAVLNRKLKETRLIKVADLDSAKAILAPVVHVDTTYCLDLAEAREIFTLASQKIIQDSIIDLQVSQISLLELDRDRLYRDFSEQLRASESKYKASQDINEHLQYVAESYQKKYDREKRKGRLLRIAVPVGVIVGLLL